MRILNKLIYISLLCIASSNLYADIIFRDYMSIFKKYGITENTTIKPIIAKCMNKFGRNNFKFIGEGMNGVLKSDFEKQFLTCTNNQILNKIKPISGITTLPKKKAEEFILNNEITFDDNSGKGKLTYVFEENGYTIFKNEKKNRRKWLEMEQYRTIKSYNGGRKNYLANSKKSSSLIHKI